MAFLLLTIPSLRAYSVLTHEAIIDSAWGNSIKPLLLARFPDSDALRLTDTRLLNIGFSPGRTH